MGGNVYALYIIYLLLDSYRIIYFFYAYMKIFIEKKLLLTTKFLKPFIANILTCSKHVCIGYYKVTTSKRYVFLITTFNLLSFRRIHYL